ncbi:MAG TPA: methyltransferase domain-containing protein [Amycolatopsis sp.]|nr:methyltransferase domain-containing protein [Amycolatopsis sp.]
MARSFDDLVTEASSVSVAGWDFSWLEGRATEQRPSWGYQSLIAARLADVQSAVDLETGGGEVLSGVPVLPPLMVATESWPPNLSAARSLLGTRGATVVAAADEPPLPFRAGSFDLVVSRHPVTVWWSEIARVLRPGGTYLSQQVGPASVFELVEYFLGPQPAAVREGRHPDHARAAAERAGLTVTDLRFEKLRTEFFDIGAVIYFLRKVIWMVPGFTVSAYLPQLRALHDQLRRGPFVATTTRFLIEAHKP